MKTRDSILTILAAAGALLIVVMLGRADRVLAQTPSGPPSLDPVGRLAAAIDRGAVTLEFRPGTGYLRSLLDRLDVAVDSQVLVFSKTSFQQALISPRAPRAVFFNDTVAVGAVQNGEVIELAAVDPDQGLLFYTLSTRPSDTPRFERRGVQCAFCHLPGNHGAPGLVVTSVLPDRDGVPFFSGSFFSTTDHRTPFDQRWGGWYVSGTHGSQTHLGNAVAPDPDRPVELDQSASLNVTSLAGRFDATNYLSPTSDIVSLMTLEHQAGMLNRILGVKAQHERSQRSVTTPNAARDLDRAIDEMVAYMVFADEAPLREPVAGVSPFSRTFPERGPRDARGRSLRDFDLRTRLFQYPLSFMIYSEAFDHLPPTLRERVYRRLYDVLTGVDTRDMFAAVSADRRRCALEILLETKTGLPDYWQASPSAPLSRIRAAPGRTGACRAARHAAPAGAPWLPGVGRRTCALVGDGAGRTGD